MNFNDVINNRWSVRAFANVPVEKEKLQSIIDTTITAPTAKNMQPVHTYVITNADMLKKVDDISACRYGATAVFAVCYNTDECWTNDKGDSRGEMDASIAATHIMLAATNEGLGTCWVCLFDEDKLRDALKLPQNEKPVCLIMVGYTADTARPSERHTTRKPLDKAFTFVE